MATPHVAGTAALLLSRAPGLDPAGLQRHLERTALPLGPTAHFGRGLVQADRAVTLPILAASAGESELDGWAPDGQRVTGNGEAAGTTAGAPSRRPATAR